MTASICCIDLGTSGTKVGLVDDRGRILARAAIPSVPGSDWHGLLGFSADTCAGAVEDTVRQLVGSPEAEGLDIVGIVLTTQRATVAGLDHDGQPVTPFLLWNDTASQPAVEPFCKHFAAARYRAITGVPPVYPLSLFKLLQMRAAVPDSVLKPIARYACLHDFMLRRWGADDWYLDHGNAACTGLLDLAQRAWSEPLLHAAAISKDQLPTLVESGTTVGQMPAETADALGLPVGIPLIAGSGDQQCAALAVGAATAGAASLCLGTGGFFSVVTENPPDTDCPLYCLPHAVPGRFVLEGACASVGSTLDWIASTLGRDSVQDLEAVAEQSPAGSNGVLFLPHLTGTGSPDYLPETTGVMLGLRFDTTTANQARAVFEGICFELARMVASAQPIEPTIRLVLSGNVSRSPLIRQLLGQVLKVPVSVSEEPDTALLGVAAIGWAGLGTYPTMAAAARTFASHSVLPMPVKDDDMPVYAKSFEAYRSAVLQHVIRPTLGTLLPPSNSHDDTVTLRKSLNLAGVAFYCYKLDGTLTYVDHASLKILDLADVYPNPSVLIGRNVRDLVQYVGDEGALRKRLQRDGKAHNYVYHFKTLKGDDRWTLHDSFIDVNPVTGEQTVQAMVRDVTADIKGGQALADSRGELRELARRLVDAREIERAELARDIHDGIGQYLCGLHLQLGSLKSQPELSDASRVKLNLLNDRLTEVADVTRRLIHGLRPPVLDELGLIAAIRDELLRLEADAGIKTQLTTEGDTCYCQDAALATDLFRIYQEAITNIVRHADAHRIEITITCGKDQVAMRVCDDGNGLQPGDTDKATSFGLVGIRERAIARGGSMQFDQREPHGTELLVTLPHQPTSDGT